MPIINKLVTSSINFSVHKTSLELLYDDLLIKNNVEEEIYNSNHLRKIEFNEKFELKNVFFEYPDRKGNIFKNVNISVKKGEIIGVVGESGSGKTTLIEIMMGLLKPTSGEVIIDNKDVLNHENRKHWYSNISYVPQNIFLNDDTIRNNIAFSESGKSQLNYKINKSVILSGLKKIY